MFRKKVMGKQKHALDKFKLQYEDLPAKYKKKIHLKKKDNALVLAFHTGLRYFNRHIPIAILLQHVVPKRYSDNRRSLNEQSVRPIRRGLTKRIATIKGHIRGTTKKR